MKRVLLLVPCLLLLTGALWLEALLAPNADPWPRWEKHDPESTRTIDHTAWDAILKSYVRASPDGVNRFAYSRISASDIKQLHAYIRHIAALPISAFNRWEQLAYWINLYNALTIQVIVTHYPVGSVRQINLGDGDYSDGPWKPKLIKVEDEKLSLNDIEHRILRPNWTDPRIHYALNRASIGSPNLRRDAFVGETVNRALESAARDFINNARGVLIDDGKLIISSIYVWFWPDFGSSEKSILEHLRRYAGPTLRSKLNRMDTIADHRFDWDLNATDLDPQR
tara:strand:- start:3431 stop:4276 length:846 start_codon:yes stop_codon:yes gene_type:complete